MATQTANKKVVFVISMGEGNALTDEEILVATALRPDNARVKEIVFARLAIICKSADSDNNALDMLRDELSVLRDGYEDWENNLADYVADNEDELLAVARDIIATANGDKG